MIVVEAAPGRPVAVEPGRFEESIPFFEQKMILDQRPLRLGRHPGEGIVSPGQIIRECLQPGGDPGLYLITLFSGDSRSEWKTGYIAPDTDAC